PWKYLGWKILAVTIEPQQIELQINTKMLNDLQKRLGAINLIRPYLGITNTDLSPLF
ncbi:POK25 protein, partial [Rhinopomastus cyanomelas]|nr:POK25 protein [Rhinopomastus cyanomelas]